MARKNPKHDGVSIGRRDRELLSCWLEGNDPKQIADLLEVAVATVEGRLRSLAIRATGSSKLIRFMQWLHQHDPVLLATRAHLPRGMHKRGCCCGQAACRIRDSMRPRLITPPGDSCVEDSCVVDDQQEIMA